MSKWFGWILGIGTLIGAVYLWWSKRNNIADLKTALEVQKVREEVAKSEAILQEKLADAAAAQPTIDAIEANIAAQKALALKLAHGTDFTGKTDQEIARIFSDSGL